MIELLQNIPSIKLKSIRPDRGMEFTLHAEITAALDLTIQAIKKCPQEGGTVAEIVKNLVYSR